MPSSYRGAVRLLGFLVVVGVVAGCSPGVAEPGPDSGKAGPTGTSASPPAVATPEPASVVLTTDRDRRSGIVADGGGDSPYNYGPTVLLENGRYRMWWCSQLGYAAPAGDDLLYAESTSPDGPFSAPGGGSAIPVLSGSTSGFDGKHTCDPSVIKVGPTYYLYYTGAAGEHAHGNAIGVATSTDGLTWARAADGKPIVSPSYDTTRENTYGAGQPSVLYLDGWFYLMFTDTTGKAAGWNGAGQFVLRSKVATFLTGVEALGPNGFHKVEDAHSTRERSVVDAFSADLSFVPALDAFVIAHETEQGTTLTFWNRDFTAEPYGRVHVAGPWREGPGLVRTPHGLVPVSDEDPCGRIAFDVVRATVDGRAGAPTDLTHFGLDVAEAPGCATTRAAAALEGFAVPSPENTVDLVLKGQVVRIERRSVTDRLATKVLDHRPAIVDKLPVKARIPAGAKAVRSPDGTVGLVLGDDKKVWLVDAEEIAALNGSTVTAVSKQTWDGYQPVRDLLR
ncbi:beta-xylosidase [Saccharothrix violaceirubra]|uniref:Beta-xylosidase n=1 Tax=Saccharothrix violaceirubra TaxID=413306 RepID=A0A7W7WUZ5_9PSEU|nr:beta-xylosidase [Saccharothrix violaceirubra]MBB4964591.1 hypothetical protein [Saccharothrix violaceirubra]